MKLAENICEKFEYLPFKMKGASGRSDLYLLKKTKCPSVITEPLFVSHTHESAFLNYSRGVEVIGELIAYGIISWVKSI